MCASTGNYATKTSNVTNENTLEADRYFFSQIEEELIQDETLSQQARSNSIDNFKYGFEEVFLTKLIEHMDANHEIFGRIMDDEEFGTLVRDWMLKKVYSRLTKNPQ